MDAEPSKNVPDQVTQTGHSVVRALSLTNGDPQ